MALKVWLPLNGSLENKGISDPTIALVGTPTVNNSGKIGKCYTFSGSNGISVAQQILPSQTPAWSFACWFSLANTTTTTSTCFFSERTGANANGYSIFIYPKTSSMLVDDGTRWTVTPMTFSANTWYHLTVTRDSSGKKIYINGELKSSTTTIGNTTAVNANGCLVGLAQSGTALATGDQGFIGNLNDVRIYDHCLSPKEVKEISQGLVLHYKLDGLSQGNGDNLVTGLTKGGQTTVVGDTIVTSGQNSDTYFKIVLSSALELNKSYTMGIDAENLPDGGYFRFPIGSQSNSSAGYIDIYNGHNEAVFTANDVIVNCGTSLMMDDNVRTAWPNQCIFKNFYIYENTSIDDSSGYGNDGTILGNPYINSDADRYRISTYFDGVDDGILIENLTLSSVINDQVSYSFWIKPEGENGGRSVYFGSYSSTSWSVEKTARNVLRLYWNGSPDETCSGATITDGTWQHIVITKNGANNIKVYINGVQKWTSTAAHNTLSFPTTYRIGRDTRTGDGTPYHGLMNDFRIYATALSAEDILDLYHTSANIDNLGELHSFELKEDIDGRELLALPWTSTYGTHNKTSLWTEFNENGEWTSSVCSSSGSDYIKINPTGKTYYYDTEISVAAGNQFYIGFERYDASKTARSNQACIYIVAIKPSTDINHQRYFGTVNLATDGVNPTDTIALRILNAWSGTDSTSTKKATIHYLSLREVTGTPQTNKIFKNGQDFTDEFVQRDGIASIYQNGIVGASNFIEK